MPPVIDANPEAIKLYGAVVGDAPARRAVKMIGSAQLQTLVPMCVIDRRESGEEATSGSCRHVVGVGMCGLLEGYADAEARKFLASV